MFFLQIRSTFAILEEGVGANLILHGTGVPVFDLEYLFLIESRLMDVLSTMFFKVSAFVGMASCKLNSLANFFGNS